MTVRLVWRNRGLDLHPTWIIESARIHTVKNFELPDGTRQDTFVLYAQATAEQCAKLVEDYGKRNMNFSILGIKVFPLLPNAVLWTWHPPKGYEGIRSEAYDAFEIHAMESKDDESA